VVGAVCLSLVREALVDHPTIAQVAYGAVVVLVVVFAPTGLAGIPARIRALRGRQGTAARLAPFRPYPLPDKAATPAGPPMLRADNVTMRFRGLKALDDVTLTVAEGEIRGIVGPNGSGKTTLFNVISGLYRPTGGRVEFRGQDMTGRSPYRLARAGMSRTFQNLRLFGDMTVEENVLVALDRSRTLASWRYLLGPLGILRRDRELHRQAREVLERYGLTGFAALPPKSLPYGIQRRVEIARAVAAAPSLLLLDEPAAGLNGEEVRQLSEIVRSIRDSGVTVLIIEHNMGLVMSLCERVTVLAGGRVIAEGVPAEVARTPAVIEAYLGDSMSTDDLPSAPSVPEVTG
jgi:branched-chain amino acid transport system permease protein